MTNFQQDKGDVGHRADEDKKLVLGALQDEAGAFAVLVEHYMPSVYAVGWSQFHERERAEELVQEVFFRAFLGLKDLQRPELFPVWVHRIARNLASTWKRNGCRKSKLVQMIPLEEGAVEIPDERNRSGRERLLMAEEDAKLREAVVRLPEDLREVVLLHFSDELTLSEIARRLGLATSSVSRRLQRALTLLRADLGDGELGENSIQRAQGAFRPSPQAVARTIAGVGSLALLSTQAKAAVVATAAMTEGGLTAGASVTGMADSAGVSSGTSAVSQSAPVPGQPAKWGALQGSGKFVTAVVAAVFLAGGIGAAILSWGPFSQASVVDTDIPSVSHKASARLRTSAAPTGPGSAGRYTQTGARSRVKSTARGMAAAAADPDSVVLPVHVVMDGGVRVAGAEVRCSTLLDYVSDNRTTETRESARKITVRVTDEKGNVKFPLPKQTARVRLDASSPDAISSGREVTVEPGYPIVLTLRQGRRVSGTVYREDGGERVPAAGATVMVASETGKTATCGPDGKYTLAGLSGKKAEIIATLGTLRAPARRDDRHVVDLGLGSNGPVDLVLRPAASLVGGVIDRETGEPIPGAQVRAFALVNGPNHLETYNSNQDQTTVTDSKGMFSFEGLLIGSQKLRVLADGYGDSVKEIDLVSGDTNSTLLALNRGGMISVNAIDRDGLPVEGATLNVMRKGGWFLAARTDRNGQVTLPGVDWEVPHTLWVWKHSTKSRVEEVVLKRGEARTSVTLEFGFRTAENESPGVILGTVKDEAGRPIQNVSIYAQQAWAVDRDTMGDRHVPNAYGEFRLERRGATGTYYISIAGENWAPAWAATQYGTVNEPEHLNFVLKKGQLLEGIVVDSQGKGIAGVTVRPYPLAADVFSYSGHPGMRETITNADGVFRLKDMPGPQVMLRARKPGWLMADEGGVTVAVDQPVRLAMARAGKIAGRVVDSGRKPVPDFAVRIVSGGDIHSHKEQQFFSKDGSFEISDLVPGRAYQLMVVRVTDQHSSASKTLKAQAVGTGEIAEDLLILE